MFKSRRFHWRVALVAGVAAALLALPATALAQDALSNPAEAQYEPQSQIQGTNTTGSGGGGGGPVASNTANNGTSAASGNGSLPFTGMDLVVVAGTALSLIAAGFVLHRLSAPRAPQA
jgi:hypothetical protein